MTSTATPLPNLLLHGQNEPLTRPFEGEQRSRALAVLATSISESRVMAVMQLFNKDPSLSREVIAMTGDDVVVEQVEVPLACLRSGISAGYVFAIRHGYQVNAPLQAGTTTLLQEALEMASSGRAGASDVGLLLSLGADWSAMPSMEPLYGVVAHAFPAKGKCSQATVNMLLDAKANFGYSSDWKCPFSVIVSSSSWNNPDTALPLAKAMVRFVKAGLDPNRATGIPAQTPLMRALGSKNGVAVVALVRLGVKTSPDVLGGKDLFAAMTANGLDDMKPAVQAALMEMHISRVTGEKPADSQEVPEGGPKPASTRRRRMGAV